MSWNIYSLWLSDGDARTRLSEEKIREESVLELLIGVAQQGGHAKSHASGDAARWTSKTGPAHLRASS